MNKTKKNKDKSLNEFLNEIELDSFLSLCAYKDEATFRRELITDTNEINKSNKIDREYYLLLNQDEIVIPNVREAYIRVNAEAVSIIFPVFAKYPSMTDEEFEALERGEKLPEIIGITRGHLQWQICKALSELPIFDHTFPEGLYLDELIKDKTPIYALHLGS